MREIPSRAAASAVARITPDPALKTTPTPILEREKQFTVRLKTNAQWMKEFLHGGK